MAVYTVTYLGNNYGSVLQALALQKTIRSHGTDAYVLIKKNTAEVKASFADRVINFLRPRKNYTLIRRLKLRMQGKKYAQKNQKIRRFVREHLSVLYVDSTKEAVDRLQPGDVLLAGSDQIWNMMDAPVPDWYTFRWEGIPEGVRKYSYAASIGLSELSEEQKNQYSMILRDIETVSLRERQAAILLQPLLKQPVRCDLDPTLLCDEQFWLNYTGERKETEPYIFVYMLRPDKALMRAAGELGRETGKKVFYTGKMADRFCGVETVYDMGIEDFLAYVKYADCVITNSFHGTVFSVLFHKQFLSKKIASTSSRTENLLTMLDLMDRYVEEHEGLRGIDDPIDYDNVDKKLAAEREKSLKYIREICRECGSE